MDAKQLANLRWAQFSYMVARSLCYQAEVVEITDLIPTAGFFYFDCTWSNANTDRVTISADGDIISIEVLFCIAINA